MASTQHRLTMSASLLLGDNMAASLTAFSLRARDGARSYRLRQLGISPHNFTLSRYLMSGAINRV